MISFSIYDYILIVVYFLAAIYIGFRTGKKDDTEENYLVMGRRLTLPAFVATLVSSFYGGVLGVGEFTYRYGISSWFLNAFPYYVFITIFAVFFAAKIRKTQLFTIPDKLNLVYGKKVSVFGAVMIFLLATPAPYLFMLGIITSMIFGFPMWLSMLLCLIISVVYLYKGGLNADVRVNIFEFVLMFLGFGIIIPFCFINLGSFEFLGANLPVEHLTVSGGHSAGYIIVWFFIGAWAIVDPAFHQRCYAAKSEKTAVKGVFISLIFWFIFDAMTTIAGLYSAAVLKDIPNPAMSYPLLAESILPAVAKGFFFIGLIATIMSTLHSYMFISASTLGKDIVNRIKGRGDDGNRFSKAGITTASVLSLVIALLVPSVVEIWYIVGSITIPSLLIAVVSSYFSALQIGRNWILSAMIVSFLFSFFWVIFRVGFIEPMYPGLVSGLAVYAAGYIIKEKDIA